MLVDLLRHRRSVRRYKRQPVAKVEIDLLVEAALRSPSSRGLRPWELVVVTAPQVIARLAEAKPHGAAFVAEAPLVMVVCGLPAESDVWVEDASIVTMLVHLAAADLGLGSCWVQIRGREHGDGRSAEAYVAEVLGLPEGRSVEAIVAIGHPAESPAGHASASLPWDKVSYLSP